MRDDGGYSDLIRLAWHEFTVAASRRGTCIDALIDFGRPPRWFALSELGFGDGQGPSLAATFERWRRTNQELLTALDPTTETSKHIKPSGQRPSVDAVQAIIDAAWARLISEHRDHMLGGEDIADTGPTVDGDDMEAA